MIPQVYAFIAFGGNPLCNRLPASELPSRLQSHFLTNSSPFQASPPILLFLVNTTPMVQLNTQRFSPRRQAPSRCRTSSRARLANGRLAFPFTPKICFTPTSSSSAFRKRVQFLCHALRLGTLGGASRTGHLLSQETNPSLLRVCRSFHHSLLFFCSFPLSFIPSPLPFSFSSSVPPRTSRPGYAPSSSRSSSLGSPSSHRIALRKPGRPP